MQSTGDDDQFLYPDFFLAKLGKICINEIDECELFTTWIILTNLAFVDSVNLTYLVLIAKLDLFC